MHSVVNACPPASENPAKETSVEIIDPAMCLYCGHCKAVCPADAFQFSEGNDQFLSVPDKKEIPSPEVFFRFLRRRRSLRFYQDRLVEKTKLKMLIEAGRYAPTGSNRQACEYVVVSGRKTLDKVCTLAIRNLQEQGKELQKVIDETRKKKPSPKNGPPGRPSPRLGADRREMGGGGGSAFPPRSGLSSSI
jgi:ferredoxin